MVKRHQIENIVPFTFTLVSIYFFIKYFPFKNNLFFGVPVTIAGLTIWWSGKLALDDSFTALPKAKKLITKGIYSKFRHPIYIGWSLTLIGWGFLLESSMMILISIIITTFLIIKSYFEEKVLLKKFGRKYQEYKRKTWF